MSEALNFPEHNTNSESGGYALLANVGRLEISSPFQITESIILRRAQPHEVDTFHKMIENSIPPSPFIPMYNLYEIHAIPTQESGGQTSYSIETLKEDEYRYNVVELKGVNQPLQQFAGASSLTPWEIDIGITILKLNGGKITAWYGGQITAGIDSDHPLGILPHDIEGYFLSLDYNALSEIKDVFDKLSLCKNNSLHEAISGYRSLKSSGVHPLQFLGYVAILESLITHAPESKDPYDSLTRQVRQKMLLLDHRFIRKLPYERYFEPCNPGKIWTKLYSYRSAIAHGTNPDFSGEYKILRNQESALNFIRCATSLTMRQALEEPDLISDLCEC